MNFNVQKEIESFLNFCWYLAFWIILDYIWFVSITGKTFYGVLCYMFKCPCFCMMGIIQYLSYCLEWIKEIKGVDEEIIKKPNNKKPRNKKGKNKKTKQYKGQDATNNPKIIEQDTCSRPNKSTKISNNDQEKIAKTEWLNYKEPNKKTGITNSKQEKIAKTNKLNYKEPNINKKAEALNNESKNISVIEQHNYIEPSAYKSSKNDPKNIQKIEQPDDIMPNQYESPETLNYAQQQIANLTQPVYIKQKQYISPGIPNYGNTCYLNSIIQILFNTPEFTGSINTCLGLSEVFKSMKTPNNNLKLKIMNFLKNISMEYQMFTLGNQNDCKELYTILIEKMAEENIDASNFFKINKTQEIKCCMGHIDVKIEPNYFIVLPKHFDSFIESYLNYSKDEKCEFNGANSLWCQICNGCQSTTITTVSLELSQIFAIYTPGKTFKNIKSIESFSYNEKNYELYGVICFYEGAFVGHYTAYILNEDGQWREYNDAFVTIKRPDVKHVYMLFYRLVGELVILNNLNKS